MRLKWILVGIGVLVVALVVTAVAILMSLDLNQYRDRIAAEVEAYTGRKASIAGPIGLEISLSPAIAIENVTLANASWGTRPEMLKVKRFEAKVELLPLLSGSVHIRRIVLEDADILLETDKSGAGNWMFGKPGAKSAGEAAPPQPEEPTPAAPESEGEFTLPTFNDITVERSTLTYRDGKTKKVTVLALHKLKARSESTRAPLTVDFAGQYNDIPVEIAGTLGSIAGLMAGARVPVDLEAKTTGLDLRLVGEVDRPGAERGTELRITAEGAELGQLSKLAGARIPALGPYRVSLSLKQSKRGISAEAIEAVIGTEDLVLASATGAVADLASVAGINIQVEVKGRSLAAVGPALGASLPAAGPYQASAHISGGRKAMKLENLAITVADSDIAGDATLALGGPRPRLDAVLGSVNFDVEDLGLEAGSGGGSGASTGGAKDGRVFPADPIPLDILKLMDGTLSFAGKKIVADPVLLEHVNLKIALANGRLTVQPAEANVTGGTIRLEASVNGTNGPASVKMKLTARRVEAGALLELLQVREVLSGGRADLDLDVAGRGGSVRALMAGLDGSSRLVMGPGRIDNRFARILLADVGQLVIGSSGGDSSNVNCVVSHFVIAKGQAESRAMVLDTNGATIEGSGSINLAEERLALALVPRAKQTNLASLAVPLRVTGTLASPTVIPDPEAIALGVVEGVARAPGNVVESLVGLVDGTSSGSTASGDPCAAAKSAATGAVKPVGTAPAVSGTKTKSSGSGSLTGSGGVEGLVKGFSQSLDGVFGGSGGGATSGAGKQPTK